MLPGVKIKEIIKFPDERGSFAEIFRKDWSDVIEPEDEIVIYENPRIKNNGNNCQDFRAGSKFKVRQNEVIKMQSSMGER